MTQYRNDRFSDFSPISKYNLRRLNYEQVSEEPILKQKYNGETIVVGTRHIVRVQYDCNTAPKLKTIETYLPKIFSTLVVKPKNTLEGKIESLSNAFARIKNSINDPEQSQKFNFQLNHFISSLIDELKKRDMADREIAAQIKACELEAFPEYSTMFKNKYTQWINSNLKQKDDIL